MINISFFLLFVDPLVLKPPDQASLLLLQGAGQLSHLSSRITYFMAILQAQVSITCFIKNILPTPSSKLYLAHLALHLLLQPLELLGPLLQAAPTPSTLPHDHMIIHLVIIAALKRS